MPGAATESESRTGQSSRVWRLLWAVAILFVLYGSTLPFAFVTDFTVIQEHWMQAIGRSAWSNYGVLSRSDLLQNVLLFVPIGFIGAAALFRTRQIVSVLLAVGAAFALSVSCELLQLLTQNRVTSAWDVWANCGGAMAGATLYVAIRPITARAWASLPPAATDRRRIFPVWCATALLVIAACEPFDITLDVGAVWSKVKPFITGSIWVWRPLSDELLTVVRFATLAYLLARWLAGPGSPTRLQRLTACLAVSSLAVSLEAMQLLISSRSPSIQDLLAALAGVVFGLGVVPSLLRVMSGTVLLVIATLVAAIPFYLQPFAISPAYGSVAMMPFLAYYAFTSLQTLSHVFELMLIFAPVGFAIVWAHHHVRTAIALTAFTAAILEFSQGWIVGRFPDLTDLAMAILGCVVGVATARAAFSGTPAEDLPGSSHRPAAGVQQKSPL